MNNAERHLHGERPEKMYGYKELEKLIGVHRTTIIRWIKIGEFPKADVTISKSLKWLESTITSWQTGTWQDKSKTRKER